MHILHHVQVREGNRIPQNTSSLGSLKRIQYFPFKARGKKKRSEPVYKCIQMCLNLHKNRFNTCSIFMT